jgi:hypothetical protein
MGVKQRAGVIAPVEDEKERKEREKREEKERDKKEKEDKEKREKEEKEREKREKEEKEKKEKEDREREKREDKERKERDRESSGSGLFGLFRSRKQKEDEIEEKEPVVGKPVPASPPPSSQTQQPAPGPAQQQQQPTTTQSTPAPPQAAPPSTTKQSLAKPIRAPPSVPAKPDTLPPTPQQPSAQPKDFSIGVQREATRVSSTGNLIAAAAATAPTANPAAVVTTATPPLTQSDGEKAAKRKSEGVAAEDTSDASKRSSGSSSKSSSDGRRSTESPLPAEDAAGDKKPDKDHPTIIVSVPTRPLSTATSAPGEAPKSKREHIEHEILVSEQSYVEGLRVMLEVYEAPLRAEDPPIVSDDDINGIFSNARTIYSFNVVLLQALSAKTEPIGKIFVRLTPFFKSYTLYSKTFDDATALMQRLKKSNADFRKFLERQAKKHTDVQSLDLLDAMLITPIQRIPRYNLLLQDLIKNTDAAHQDLPNLTKALALMKEVADAVDGSIKFSENINKLMRIQSQISWRDKEHVDLVQPHR